MTHGRVPPLAPSADLNTSIAAARVMVEIVPAPRRRSRRPRAVTEATTRPLSQLTSNRWPEQDSRTLSWEVRHVEAAEAARAYPVRAAGDRIGRGGDAGSHRGKL